MDVKDTAEPVSFSREVFLDHLQQPLVIHQISPSDVGGVVWDGALVLANFLSKFKPEFTRDATIVELGAGTGVVGLACATLPARKVIITDLPELRDLVERNIAQNRALLLADSVEFVALDWTRPTDLALGATKPKLILASECVYYEDAVEPLLKTMDYLSGPESRIFVSFELREQEKHVETLRQFIALAKTMFDVKEVPRHEQHEDYNSSDIKVLLLVKKKS